MNGTRPETPMPIAYLAIAAALVLGAMACAEKAAGPDGTQRDSTVAVATVTVTPGSLSLTVNGSGQLSATPKDSAGNVLTGRQVVWTSSESTVATVSAAGFVTAVSIGTTLVTATVEGKADTALVSVTPTPPPPAAFNFSRELFGTPRSLSAWVGSLDGATGEVTIAGVDSRQPHTPFTFDWGDGQTTSEWFDASHTYANTSRNYVVRVTAHYGAATDFVETSVRFTAPQITPAGYPAQLAVTIPSQVPGLVSRQPGYYPPAGLVAFDDSYFTAALPRSDVEYVLSQAAAVEAAIVENDMETVGGGFQQVVLRDPVFGGAYSIWFTTPVAFAADGAYFQGTPGWSSLFHEMAHNFTLNSPAAYRLGGRIDGAANAIVSEALAQMFQHAVAFELVNNPARYGLPEDLTLDIASSARSSAQIVRSAYDAYVSRGKPFAAWNDEATPDDETFDTFMTVARQFMVHAEQIQSYVAPLTRVMRLLRTFDEAMLAQYAPQTNSTAASAFRATLMVAALSYGFQADLRAEFRSLGFPLDDATFVTLYHSLP